jgi:hypothetical protein
MDQLGKYFPRSAIQAPKSRVQPAAAWPDEQLQLNEFGAGLPTPPRATEGLLPSTPILQRSARVSDPAARATEGLFPSNAPSRFRSAVAAIAARKAPAMLVATPRGWVCLLQLLWP